MPSFVAIIVGGLGSLPGTLLGGLLIGVASGITTVFFPSASEAVMYVMMAAGAAGAAARPVRRGGAVLMPQSTSAPPTSLIWLLLLRCRIGCRWSAAISSSAAASLVYALAAMSLNFLLGFTGVLSFGHAAYFGLGAYGAGLTIKYLLPSTLLGMLVGVIVGTIAAAIIGALIVRLRGIYFAMCTIAFGQVFYFIAFQWVVTGGDDGVTGWQRVPIDSGFTTIDILGNDKAFYYFVLAVCGLRRRHGGAAALALRPHPAGDPRERAARALSRHSGRSAHLAVLGDFVPVRQPRRHALSRCSTISPIRTLCAGTNRAIS